MGSSSICIVGEANQIVSIKYCWWWWECPWVNKYWNGILKSLRNVTGYDIGSHPDLILLNTYNSQIFNFCWNSLLLKQSLWGIRNVKTILHYISGLTYNRSTWWWIKYLIITVVELSDFLERLFPFLDFIEKHTDDKSQSQIVQIIAICYMISPHYTIYKTLYTWAP